MKIVFNDLSELTIQHYANEGKYLAIKTIDATPEELRTMFEDKTKTRVIKVVERDDVLARYDGFTVFYSTEEYTGGIYGVRVYKPDTTPQAEAKVLEASVKIARLQAQDLDDETAIEVKDIYPLWNGNGISYGVGCKVLYGGTLYKCVQAHTSQDDWTPTEASSLWAKVLNEGINEWEQPSSTNPYMKGDKVRHNGLIYESLVDNNVWEPGTVGTESLWAVVNE